jgi:Cys-tRNA(Pro) deacylase
MSKATRATKMLEQAGIAFTLHSYEYQPDADRIGLQAAEALHERPERVLKTLMALVDDKPVCVIIPSDREVAMKKLAAAFAGRSAKMMAANVVCRSGSIPMLSCGCWELLPQHSSPEREGRYLACIRLKMAK